MSFALRPGEVLGLVGESGCGKSTLGRGLMGLLPRGAAIDGELVFAGTDLLRLPPKERDELRGAGMGLIFQEPMTRLDPADADQRPLRRGAEGARARSVPQVRPATARWKRCAPWASRRPAIGTTRTSSPAACGSGS